MLTVPAAVKLWFCATPVSMRLGFDGLFLLVRERLRADPLSGHLFIFRVPVRRITLILETEQTRAAR